MRSWAIETRTVAHTHGRRRDRTHRRRQKIYKKVAHLCCGARWASPSIHHITPAHTKRENSHSRAYKMQSCPSTLAYARASVPECTAAHNQEAVEKPTLSVHLSLSERTTNEKETSACVRSATSRQCSIAQRARYPGNGVWGRKRKRRPLRCVVSSPPPFCRLASHPSSELL